MKRCARCQGDYPLAEFRAPNGHLLPECRECHNRTNAEYLRRAGGHTERDGDIMPFEEIGRKLGITREGARRCYLSAVKKLKFRYKHNSKFAAQVDELMADAPEPAALRVPKDRTVISELPITPVPPRPFHKNSLWIKMRGARVST